MRFLFGNGSGLLAVLFLAFQFSLLVPQALADPPARVSPPAGVPACEGTMGPISEAARAVEDFRSKWAAEQPYPVHVWSRSISVPEHDGGIIIAYVTGARGGVAVTWRRHPQTGAECVLSVRGLSPVEIMALMTPEEVKEYRVGGGPVL